MNSIGASILILLITLILFAPQRWALLGMMSGVLYLTQQQVIVVLGLNLTAIRLLELVCFTRILVRRELLHSGLNGIDRAFLMAYGYIAIVFLMRSDVGQKEMFGSLVDSTLCYFSFRVLIRDAEGLKWFLCAFVIILVPYVSLLSVEMLTHKNPFVSMGALTWHDLRGGRLRVMGSFRNPSLLGTLGASLLPLYIGLVFTMNNRRRAFAGLILCFGIVFLANSGGPLNALLMGLVGWLCWNVRKKMFLVRRSLFGMLVLLALVMKAPIWYLPAKISSLSGGDGWHRSHLIDMAMRDLGQWWFVGMDIAQTKDWFPYGGLAANGGAADITNNFIAFGLNGGLLAMALLIFLFIRAFQAVGQALSVVRNASESNEDEYLLWGLGCVLAVHIITWLGITYFDQIYAVWFMQLAAISSISHSCTTTNNTNSMKKQLVMNQIRKYHKWRVLPAEPREKGLANENSHETPS